MTRMLVSITYLLHTWTNTTALQPHSHNKPTNSCHSHRGTWTPIHRLQIGQAQTTSRGPQLASQEAFSFHRRMDGRKGRETWSLGGGRGHCGGGTKKKKLNSFFPQAVRALNSHHTAPLWNPNNPPPTPTLPHLRKKLLNFYLCGIQVSGPAQATCSNTHMH